MPFALTLTLVLALLAAFQLALVFGAPLGRFAWGGQHRVLPERLRIGSAVSIIIYVLIAVIAWDRVGAVEVFPAPFAEIAMWVIFAYFVLGILMNAISRSKPERYMMVPVTLVLAVLSFLIARGYGALATAILFWTISYALGSKRKLFDFGIAIIFASCTQLAFSAGLGLNLPSGFLGGIL